MQRKDFEELVKRYGEQDAKILAEGMRALDWRRHNHPTLAQPEAIKVKLPEPQPKTTGLFGSPIKCWPMIILAAILNKCAGAARLYFLARALDKTGQGWIPAGEFNSYLHDLKIIRRTRERWQRQAFELGILRKASSRREGSRGMPVIYIASLGKAGAALGCDVIGTPATIGDRALVGKGWRAWLWAAYLATTKGQPISQSVKQHLTGISDRVQRNYQKVIPTERIRNRRRVYQDDKTTAGLRDVRGWAYYKNDRGQTFQVLPDGRNVPSTISSPMPRGASRKAQRFVNHQQDDSSFIPQRRSGSGGGQRLFCESYGQVQAAIRQASEAPAWDRPVMVFELAKTFKPRGRGKVNQWRAHEV